jgi:hypothetical protein
MTRRRERNREGSHGPLAITSSAIEFAEDSPLEEAGFELMVPPYREASAGADFGEIDDRHPDRVPCAMQPALPRAK